MGGQVGGEHAIHSQCEEGLRPALGKRGGKKENLDRTFLLPQSSEGRHHGYPS